MEKLFLSYVKLLFYHLHRDKKFISFKIDCEEDVGNLFINSFQNWLKDVFNITKIKKIDVLSLYSSYSNYTDKRENIFLITKEVINKCVEDDIIRIDFKKPFYYLE